MKLIHKNMMITYVLLPLITITLLLVCQLRTALAQSENESAGITNEFRKGPYLIYDGNNTRMSVLWQLHQTSECSIAWGNDESYSTGNAKTKEYDKDHQHLFTIKKLKPGATYYYKVSFNNSEAMGSFVTAPKDKTNKVKFFVYGDTRSFPNIHNEIAKAIISDYTSDHELQTFALFVGDFVTFGAEESSWDNELFSPAYPHIRNMMASIPVLSCIGNHELYLKDYTGMDTNVPLFKKYFPYPFVKETYWSFDYGPAHFVILDQYSQGLETKQLEWMDKDLGSTKKPWKFICIHEPGWSAGGDEIHQNNQEVQQRVQPILEKNQVTAAFSGNNHYYARALVNGVYHITTGGGGASLLDPDPYAPKVISTSKTHHYCIVDINKNTLIFKALKPDGTVIDTFTLNVTEE